jgi:hypothetical protein
LIDAPVETVKGIGSGIGHWLADVGHSVVDRDRGQSDPLSTALGQAPVKRQFAYEFGVDPYSTYGPLQKELNILAWTATAGGLTAKAAFSAIGGGAGTALSVSGTAEGMRELVRDKSPAELDAAIAASLDKMGVLGPVRNRFLANSHYSLQERLILVSELAKMEGIRDRYLFFESAATAASEAVSLYMRVQAQMMGRYAKDNKVVRILEADSVCFLQEKNGTVVGVFPLDCLMWTPGVASKISQIEKDLASANLKGRKKMLFLGRVDRAAAEALKKRGWQVKDKLVSELRSL